MVPATATSKTTTPLIEMIMTALAGVCAGLSAVRCDGMSGLAVERIGNGRLGAFKGGGSERGVLVLWDGVSGLAVVVHVPGVLAAAAVVAVVRLSGLVTAAVASACWVGPRVRGPLVSSHERMQPNPSPASSTAGPPTGHSSQGFIGAPAVAVTETLVSTVVTLMVLLTGLGVGRNVVEGVRSTCGCGPPVATAGRPVAVGRVVGDVVVGAMVENVVVLQSIPQQVAGQLPRNSS